MPPHPAAPSPPVPQIVSLAQGMIELCPPVRLRAIVAGCAMREDIHTVRPAAA